MNLNEVEAFVQMVYSSDYDASRAALGSLSDMMTDFNCLSANVSSFVATNDYLTLLFTVQNIKKLVTDYHTNVTVDMFNDMLMAILNKISNVLRHPDYDLDSLRISVCNGYVRLFNLYMIYANHQQVSFLRDVYVLSEMDDSGSLYALEVMNQYICEYLDSNTLTITKLRHICFIFRDLCLTDIFRIVLEKISDIINSSTYLPKHLKLSFDICVGVLSCSLLGTNYDDSVDNLGVIDVHMSLRQFILENNCVEQIYFFYNNVDESMQPKTLEILALLASIKQTSFPLDHRRNYMDTMIYGLQNIISNQIGLLNTDNIHQLSRLILNLRTNYHMGQFIQSQFFNDFLHAVVELTKISFSISSVNSYHYLSLFWAKMVVGYLSSKKKATNTNIEMIREAASLIFSLFVYAIYDTALDPLKYEEEITDSNFENILKNISSVARLEYEKNSALLLSSIEEHLRILSDQYSSLSPNLDMVIITEKQLASTVMIIAELISQRRLNSTSGYLPISGDVDSNLIRAVFQLVNQYNTRDNIHHYTEGLYYIEYSLIIFLTSFCKNYMDDDVFERTDIFQVAFPASVFGAELTPGHVCNIIMSKIIYLLNNFAGDDLIASQILGKSGLFFSLANSYEQSDIIQNSDLVTNIILEHGKISIPKDKNREEFYYGLGRLLFSKKSNSNFLDFISSFERDINDIKNFVLNGEGDAEYFGIVFNSVISALIGLISSIHRKDDYLLFFDWFYRDSGIFLWILQFGCSGNKLLTQKEWWTILKLLAEFVKNASSRISFPNTSADGIKLFKTVCEFLVVHRDTVFSSEDKYQNQKSIILYLSVCERLLNGHYLNFGVFEMYSDRALYDLFSSIMHIIFKMYPLELNTFPKLLNRSYNIIVIISKNHTEFLINQSTDFLSDLISFLKKGLQTKLSAIVNYSCECIDKILSHHMNNVYASNHNHATQKQKTEIEAMNRHISELQSTLEYLLLDLFDTLVSVNNSSWAVSRPMLVLMFLFPGAGDKLCEVVVGSQETSSQASNLSALTDAFNNLTIGVQQDLSLPNREKFSTQLTLFRQKIDGIIDISALYKCFLDVQ